MNRHYVVLGLSFLCACGPDPRHVSFTGQWSKITDNALTNEHTETAVTVITDGRRFRLVELDPDHQLTEVYDGTRLKSDSVLFDVSESTDPDSSDDADADADSEEQTTLQTTTPSVSSPMSPDQAATLKFWSRKTSRGSKDDLLVAGRETRFSKQNDGPWIRWLWVDSETGVVLKSVETLYSDHSVITQISTVCESIDYQPIDSKIFQ